MKTTTRICFLLIFLFGAAVVCSCSDIKPPEPPPPPPPPVQAPCDLPIETLRLNDNNEADDQCIFQTTATLGACHVNSADVRGSDSSPEITEVSLYWSKVDGSSGQRTVANNGTNWAMEGVATFDTGQAGAADGTYEVKIDKAGRQCHEYGSVTIDLHTTM